MEGNILILYNKIESNNNNMHFYIIDVLSQIIKDTDNITSKKLSDIKIKMSDIINENKANIELLRNEITKLYNKLKQEFSESKNNIQEIKYSSDPRNPINKRIKYIGQVLNGVPEGKGIMYWKNGERYEGKWKNDERDGKGINIWPRR